MKKLPLYSFKHFCYSVVMILALAWVTISAPFVYKAQQQTLTEQSATGPEDENNPLSNTTEEKAPSPNTLTEEYIHSLFEHISLINDKLSHVHSHSYDVYVAFHGELISPPPDTFLS